MYLFVHPAVSAQFPSNNTAVKLLTGDDRCNLGKILTPRLAEQPLGCSVGRSDSAHLAPTVPSSGTAGEEVSLRSEHIGACLR